MRVSRNEVGAGQAGLRLLVLAGSALLAPVAGAGLLDAAPPALAGGTSRVVYRMGPVYFAPGRVDTVVTCANLDNSPIRVALEVFGSNDSLAGGVAQAELDVAGVVSFVTSADASALGQVIVPGLAAVDHGKARVSATSDRLSCTAFHRVRSTDGTLENKALGLVKKILPAPAR